MARFYRHIKDYYIIILIVLISKILLLVVSLISINILSNPRGNLGILQLWNVWDAPHYIDIATKGYQIQGVEANFIVFLPLFPLLIFLFRSIFQSDFLISGYVISFLTSSLLAVLFYKLVLLDFSKKVAVTAVFFLVVFPTAFFLQIPYTESLFILLSVCSFYFARKKYYFLSFIFISFACLTRLAGLALIPAIFAEIYFYDKDRFKKIDFLFWGLLTSLSGFFVYLALNYFIFNDPWYFTVAEKQNWHTTFSPLGQGLISVYESIFWRQGLGKIMLGYGQIIAFILGLFMSIYTLFKIRLSYGFYMLFALFFAYSMSFWLSMPRYIISLFPMFIVFALIKNKFLKIICFFTLTILQIILGLIFIQYGPVF